MIEGYLVRLPMGMGKTRIVWDNILKLGKLKQERGSWNRRLRTVLILGPNDHAERAWLRELALYALDKGVVHPERIGEETERESRKRIEKSIRGMRNRKLRNWLHQKDLYVPLFLTYREMERRRRVRCRFLVLDEWHGLPRRIRKKCKEYPKNDTRKSWFLGGQGSQRAVYFVSATPLNPVLEEEDTRRWRKELEDREFEERSAQAKSEALDVLRAFLRCRSRAENGKGGNERKNDKRRSFLDEVRDLGVKELPRRSQRKWPVPHPSEGHKTLTGAKELRDKELQEIRQFLDKPAGKNGAWGIEYAYAVGLIRTRPHRRVHRIVRSKKGRKSCFGFPYAQLYVPPKGRRNEACEWLWDEHTRIRRLLALLKEEGVLREKDGLLKIGRKKALIFCTHRGVALGLTRALQGRLGDSAARDGVAMNGRAGAANRRSGRVRHSSVLPEVATNADPVAAKGAKSKYYVEKLIDGFSCRKGRPHILIATDVLSESLDLHEACKLVIHYELAWSPLRIFQRIGRLTRLKPRGKRLVVNKPVRVAHVILPGSVEEGRVNRLVRRIKFLLKEGVWPEGYTPSQLIRGLIGGGPSLHYAEQIGCTRSRDELASRGQG